MNADTGISLSPYDRLVTRVIVGLSRMRRNLHVRFLEEDSLVRGSPYSTSRPYVQSHVHARKPLYYVRPYDVT